MTVQIFEIIENTNLNTTTFSFELVGVNNGTKIVLTINSLYRILIEPNKTIPFDEFIPLYTKALNENIHLNRY